MRRCDIIVDSNQRQILLVFLKCLEEPQKENLLRNDDVRNEDVYVRHVEQSRMKEYDG